MMDGPVQQRSTQIKFVADLCRNLDVILVREASFPSLQPFRHSQGRCYHSPEQIARDRLVAACSAVQSQESCHGCHDDGTSLVHAPQARGRQQTGRMHTSCRIEGHDANIDPG